MKQELIRVVLVDDNIGDARLLQMALQKGDVAAVLSHYENSQKAAGYFASLSQGEDIPNLIILDLNLPGLNGLELLSEVRANPYLISVPVIIYSGGVHRDENLKALLAGATAFFPKPFDYEDIEKTTKEMLSYIE